MNKKTIQIDYNEHNTIEDGVEKETIELINIAEKRLKNAYAPYSLFRVSSSLKLTNGKIISGTNQENGAYPSGICAERVAVFSAKSNYPNQKIEQIVVVTEQSSKTPFSPCGACRQALIEYEIEQKKPIKVVLKSGKSKILIFGSVRDLLPFAFDAEDILKKG